MVDSYTTIEVRCHSSGTCFRIYVVPVVDICWAWFGHVGNLLQMRCACCALGVYILNELVHTLKRPEWLNVGTWDLLSAGSISSALPEKEVPKLSSGNEETGKCLSAENRRAKRRSNSYQYLERVKKTSKALPQSQKRCHWAGRLVIVV